MNKICLIINWYGSKPSYFERWHESVDKLDDRFRVLLNTDIDFGPNLSDKIIVNKISFLDLKKKIEDTLDIKISLKRPYRSCDFRPMFGKIFHDLLKEFSFWGYTDMDVIFGDMRKFLPDELVDKYDAIICGGHFSIYRNCDRLSSLYKSRGGIFNYRTVVKHDAVFAFDETTGMHRIIRSNNINALFGIPMIDIDPAHYQIQSRMTGNCRDQVLWCEEGKTYLTSFENEVINKEVAYIHFPKRKLEDIDKIKNGFFVCSDGFRNKKERGIPSLDDARLYNPYPGDQINGKELKDYKKKKIKEILMRNPYQIYVRVKQEIKGIRSAYKR